MYSANGLMYTGEHSVSFGDIVATSSGGVPYYTFSGFNSWDTWHLIPSSNIVIAHPEFVSKIDKRSGKPGFLDLTQYFGKVMYSQRVGEINFYADYNFLTSEELYDSLMFGLHGKKMKMMLQDDPGYYYEGYFTLKSISKTASYPVVVIGYQLNPYKIKINPEGSHPVLWDPFNFEKDYDYSVIMENITITSGSAGMYTIYAGDYPFVPTATWVSGSVNVNFGNVLATLNSENTVATLGKASNGSNTLSVTGNGTIKIEWRGGSL